MARLLSSGLLGKLGPYQVPVVGAQVAASYSATCGAFDGDAVNGFRRCAARTPIADDGLGNTQSKGKFSNATNDLYSQIKFFG